MTLFKITSQRHTRQGNTMELLWIEEDSRARTTECIIHTLGFSGYKCYY